MKDTHRIRMFRGKFGPFFLILLFLIITIGLIATVQRQSPSTISKAQDEIAPIVCNNARRLVPPNALAAAVTDPQSTASWYPPNSIYLTVYNEHEPYNVSENYLVFRTSCDTPEITPIPDFNSLTINISLSQGEQPAPYNGYVFVELCKINSVVLPRRLTGITCDKSDIRKVKVVNNVGIYTGDINQ